jgi:hypothetical protein
MDIQLASIENSPIGSLLGEQSSPEDVWSYGVQSTNNNSMHRAEVVVPSPSFGQQWSVEVPKYGLVSSMYVRATLTLTGNDALHIARAGTLGLNMLDSLELATSNRVISRISQRTLAGILAVMDTDKRTQVENAMHPVEATGAAAVNYEVFIPFPYALSAQWRGNGAKGESMRGLLDTRFLETLQVRCLLKPAAKFEGATTASALTCSLIVNYRSLPEEVYRSLEQSNFGSGVLNMVNINSFSETQKTISSGATTGSINLNANGLVKKMFIQSRPATIDDDDEVVDQALSTEISKITLNGSGRELISFYGKELAFLQDFTRSTDATSVYCLDFSALPSMASYSGGLSLREIANPTIDITYASALGADNILTVEHLVYEVLSVNPANGRITVSLSS